MQSAPTLPMRGTVSVLIANAKKSDTILFLVIFVSVFSVTPLLVWGGVTIGFSYALEALAALVIAALVVRWPMSGLYVIAACAVLVEEEPLSTPILTDHLYVFYWPPDWTGQIERPIGFLLLLIFFAFIGHRLAKRQRILWGGPLLLPFIGFLLSVAWGVVHGLQTGGNFRIIVLEVRPFWYLFMAYLLAYNLLAQKRHLRALFWLIILGAGVKGLQGAYIYLIALHGNLSNSGDIMAHEESFFFVAVILLFILFCFHYRYRPQVYTILLLLPVVLLALFANKRRTDYVALLIGIGVALALVYLINPRVRRRLVVFAALSLILGGAYVLAFAHGNGALGGPARAVISVIDPTSTNASDAASDLYRLNENADLAYTVRQDPILGWGFGKQFLQPFALPNISAGDPYYLYVPHNTIYWVWMRLGAIGYTLLWYLFGAAIVRGCLIARRLRDPYLQVVAIYVVAVTVMEIIVAFGDYQLFFYRNVFYVGLLLGVLMRLPALDEAEEAARPKVDSTTVLMNSRAAREIVPTRR